MRQFQNTLVAALVLTVMTFALVMAQADPQELLQSAVYKEEVEGNLEAAIEIFEQIINNSSQNRTVTAQALLHLGSSFEKLGNQRAEDAYQKLINDFGDQQTMVSEARMRLQKIRFRELTEGMQNKGTSPTYRIAFDKEFPRTQLMWARQYNFSPNGDQVVFRYDGDIYVSDASGTTRRLLVAGSDNENEWSVSNSRAGQPRWSPDGKQIAYLASKLSPTGDQQEDWIHTVFLTAAEGGEARQLTQELDPCPFRGYFWWAPDGRGLIYLSREGVHRINLQGKIDATIEINILAKSTRLAGYSPDGRWLTIWQKADEASTDWRNTDIYLVPTSGGDAVQITFAAGFDAHPVWSTDSRSVYFISQRTAEWNNSNIWKVNVNPQTGQPVGDPEQVTFFDDAMIMHPQMVNGKRLSFYLQKVKHSVQVAPADHPENFRTLARGVRPTLSPDGKTVYYVGEGPDQQGIYAVSSEGGSPKRYTTKDPTSGSKSLSPDGSTISFFQDSDGERGLFSQPVSGGEPILLMKSDCDDCCHSVYYSPDGKSLAYTSGDGLYLISSDGGEPKKLATLNKWESWTVRWSPNGKLIAALGYKEDPAINGVFVVPVEGGEARLLSYLDNYLEGMEWHPDGQSLTYHLSLGASKTHRAFLDGRPPELFLDKPDAWDYTGVWSPDGQSYYLSNAPKGDWKTDIYNVKTGEFTPFVSAALPRWSSDQKTMVWSTEQRINQLWMVENFK